MTANELDEYVARLVDQAPPLTHEQRADLRMLLTPAPTEAGDRRASA